MTVESKKENNNILQITVFTIKVVQELLAFQENLAFPEKWVLKDEKVLMEERERKGKQEDVSRCHLLSVSSLLNSLKCLA